MKRAFTLTELLVVIAIIAVLAALLFPVFVSAKGKGKETHCLSNLKQLGIAFSLYLSDSDDQFPRAVDATDVNVPGIWASNPAWQAQIPSMPLINVALKPYASSAVFHCPSDSGTLANDPGTGAFPFPTTPSAFAQYGDSYALRTEIIFRQIPAAALSRPENINLLSDFGGHWHGSGRALNPADSGPMVQKVTHGYRYNVLFGDFHAKSVNRGMMDQLWATPP